MNTDKHGLKQTTRRTALVVSFAVLGNFERVLIGRTPFTPMNPKMVERGTSPLPSPHFAPPTPQNAEWEKRSQRLGEIVRRTVHGFKARMVRGNLDPALSRWARVKRSPLCSQSRGGKGESRFRIPSRQRHAVLLPKGEGQDEGEVGVQLPSRFLGESN